MLKTYTGSRVMYKNLQWPLTLFFDGACPLCAQEINVLRARASPQRLVFVDISEATFDAKSLGFTLGQMQSCLHARFSDGAWVTGLDATLWSWRAAGLGMWVTPLSWRFMRPVLSLGYRFFCRVRPHLGWLPHPDGRRRCTDNRCTVSPPAPSDKRPNPPVGK